MSLEQEFDDEYDRPQEATTICNLEDYFGDQVDVGLDFQLNLMEFMKWFYYESPPLFILQQFMKKEICSPKKLPIS